MGDEDNSLEILLAKAANPLNKDLDVEAVGEFANHCSDGAENAQIALQFLAHRIQSPQEKEALMALLVLEECVKICDRRFLKEVGKFKFLNELIKVVSPKYLGNRAPARVKQKILELMFKWSVELKHEPKIHEAYQMLRKQGVVTQDPVYVLENYRPPAPPSPRPRTAIFEDEENSEMLQKLLQSKNPQDLQAANRLIKNMVKEADRRMERMARTMTELEAVHNNAKVLGDMISNYRPGQTSEEEKDLMKELFESCERLRPKLFRLAGEMDEKDSGLDDILKANDELTTAINMYRKAMGMESSSDIFTLNSSKGEASLMDLGSPPAVNTKTTDVSLLDDQLLSLGLNDPPNQTQLQEAGASSTSALDELGALFSAVPSSQASLSSSLPNTVGQFLRPQPGTQAPLLVPQGVGVYNQSAALPPASASSVNDHYSLSNHNTGRRASSSALSSSSLNNSNNSNGPDGTGMKQSGLKGLEELDALGQSLLKQSLPPHLTKVDFPNVGSQGTATPPVKVPMNQLQQQQQLNQWSPQLSRAATGGPLVESIVEATVYTSSSTASPSRGTDAFSLADIFVPLDTVQPGTLSPLTLHEKHGLTVVVHFGRDQPREDVTVMVVSTMSKGSSPVKNVSFQAAVPKSMKIKLQPPSATELPPHNPILPPAAITQVMLLANPNKEKVRLKYKISYSVNDELKTEMGEIDNLFGTR